MDETAPRLVETDRGYTVSYKNRFLYSQKDPARRPGQVVAGTSFLPETLFIVPSPLLFYGIELLLDTMPESCHVLCIEVDERLMALSMLDVDRALLQRQDITVIRTRDLGPFLEVLDTIGTHKFRRIVRLRLSGGYQLFKDIYDSLFNAAESYIQQFWQNRMTLVHMGRLWVKNLFSNLARYWRDISSSIPKVGVPILVVGAGESLESALPMMRALRDRYHLLAVDTALPVLTAAQLTPDSVLALEGQTANAQDFLGHGNRSIPLICDLTSHPSTLSCCRFERSFILSAFADCSLMDRLATAGLSPLVVPPLGSVGVAAVEIARQMTRWPILLVGLDFCYVLGKPHSRGAPSHILSLSTSSRTNSIGWYTDSVKRPLVTGKDASGEPLSSDMVLFSYGKNLAEFIGEDDRIYDIRDHGFPLNIQRLGSQDQIERILEENADSSSRVVQTEFTRPLIERSEITAFLEREHRLLEMFIECFHSDERNVQLLHESLESVNYIYLDFPDSERNVSLTDDFLVRCAASASHYLEHIRHVKDYVN